MSPCLTPCSASGNGNVGVEIWFPLSMEDETLFTSFLFSVLSHRRVRWLIGGKTGELFGPEDKRWHRLCYVESIKMIRRAIQDPVKAVSDTLILSVLIMAELASDSAYESIGPAIDSPFRPPLRSLQWLDVYGAKLPNPLHIQGLITLVTKKKGLENIKLPGLAAVISA